MVTLTSQHCFVGDKWAFDGNLNTLLCILYERLEKYNFLLLRAYGLAVFYLHNVIFSKQELLNVPLGNDNTVLSSFSAPAAPYRNNF